MSDFVEYESIFDDEEEVDEIVSDFYDDVDIDNDSVIDDYNEVPTVDVDDMIDGFYGENDEDIYDEDEFDDYDVVDEDELDYRDTPSDSFFESRRLKEKVNIKELIQEVISTNWSKDNASQMKVLQILKGIATSDDPLSNKFMKKIDKFTNSLKDEFK